MDRETPPPRTPHKRLLTGATGCAVPVAHARDRTRATLAPALALTLLVAGCAGAVGSGTPTTTPDGPRTATTEAAGPSTTDGYYRAYEVTARETTPAGVARAVTLSRAGLRDRLVWRADPFVDALFETGAVERVVVAAEPTSDPGPGRSRTGRSW
jgi:hypothetical protein